MINVNYISNANKLHSHNSTAFLFNTDNQNVKQFVKRHLMSKGLSCPGGKLSSSNKNHKNGLCTCDKLLWNYDLPRHMSKS